MTNTKIHNWTDSMMNRHKDMFYIISIGELVDESGESYSTITILQFKDFDKACLYEQYAEEEKIPFEHYVLQVLNLDDDNCFVMPGAVYYRYSCNRIGTDVITITETKSLNI